MGHFLRLPTAPTVEVYEHQNLVIARVTYSILKVRKKNLETTRPDPTGRNRQLETTDLVTFRLIWLRSGWRPKTGKKLDFPFIWRESRDGTQIVGRFENADSMCVFDFFDE